MKCFSVDYGDVVISKNDIAIVSGLELERQMITAVLGTNTGEWFLNENEGINFRVILTKNPDYDLIRAEIINGLNQISSDYMLSSFSHELDSSRNLVLNLVITKRTGEEITLNHSVDVNKKEFISFDSSISAIIELLNLLIGNVVSSQMYEITYADGVMTIKLNINPRTGKEQIEKIKSIIDSVTPTYIEIVYEISEFPNPPEDFIYIIEDGEVTIISYIGTETTVIVPATIEDLPVTKISAVAFSYRDDVERIKFLDGLTTIE